MSNANGYDALFPYSLDQEDREYLHKGVQSLFQDILDGKSHSWDQRYNSSEKIPLYDKSQIPLYDKSHERNNTLSEHNYHIDSSRHSSESIPKVRSTNVSNNEVPRLESPSAEKLFSDILKYGIDNEDMVYLKQSFYQCLWDDRDSSWAQQLQWIPHPTTSDDNINIKLKLCEEIGVTLNKSGCARTEGYVKRVKKYSKLRPKYQRQETEATPANGRVLPYSKTYKGNKQALSRNARNDQRRLSTAYQTITQSNLLNLNELKFRKKKLKLGKSEIHGLGLFAAEPIGANEIIIEYVGQIIRPIIADLRENVYKQSGLGYYCFLIDDGTVVDATKYGNINRYINHSCNPNSYAKILVINNKKKIVIYSKRDIKANEEITYDYKMKIEDEKIECLCKASGCRKSLN